MKLQRNTWSCGPLSVLNALRAMGVSVTEREVRAHTATTKDEGTSEFGVRNALLRLGFDSQDFSANKTEAFKTLRGHVLAGHPVILSVEEDRHWVVAVGVVGDRVLVFDSEDKATGKGECGVVVCDRAKLLEWWRSAAGLYYGLVVRHAAPAE